MPAFTFTRFLVLHLLLAVVLAACSSDGDGEAPTAPEPESAIDETSPDAVARDPASPEQVSPGEEGGEAPPAGSQPVLTDNESLLKEMETALQAAVVVMLTGGGTVPGAGGGQVLVEGVSFIFQDYSPDGLLVIGGQLDLDILASPATLKGTIRLSGSMESEVLVDMTIDASSDPFTYGGTLTVDGEVFDVATLREATTP